VTVHFDCTSGAPVTSCPADATVSNTDADGEVIGGDVTDLLGRTAHAEILIRADTTIPELSPTVTPNPVLVGDPASAVPHATDAGSGIASESCDTPSTDAPGSFTVQCRAVDVAGNEATAPAAYTVDSPVPRLCQQNLDRAALQPVNPDGSSVFSRTSGVPVKFSACDGSGNPIGTKNFVTSVTVVSSSALTSEAGVNEQKYPPAASFVYSKSTGTWLGYIQASKLSPGKKYVFSVLLADGTSFTMAFGIR